MAQAKDGVKMSKKIKPPTDFIEMAAALEVAKSIAFQALAMALTSYKGTPSEIAN
jgi:hypothetical protein